MQNKSHAITQVWRRGMLRTFNFVCAAAETICAQRTRESNVTSEKIIFLSQFFDAHIRARVMTTNDWRKTYIFFSAPM